MRLRPNEIADRLAAAPISASTLDLSGIDLSGLTVPSGGLTLIETDLSSAKLAACKFVGVDFTGCRFTGADVTGLSFTRSKLDRTDFRNVRDQVHSQESLSFELSDLHQADFSGVVLHGLHIMDCDCSGATFRGARLHRAAFKGIVWRVDFREAQFSDCDFTRAQFIDCDLAASTSDDPGLIRGEPIYGITSSPPTSLAGDREMLPPTLTSPPTTFEPVVDFDRQFAYDQAFRSAQLIDALRAKGYPIPTAQEVRSRLQGLVEEWRKGPSLPFDTETGEFDEEYHLLTETEQAYWTQAKLVWLLIDTQEFVNAMDYPGVSTLEFDDAFLFPYDASVTGLLKHATRQAVDAEILRAVTPDKVNALLELLPQLRDAGVLSVQEYEKRRTYLRTRN